MDQAANGLRSSSPPRLISKEFGVRFLKEFWEDFKLIIEGLKEEKLSHGFSFFRFV
jgi:hypothetical protein